MKKATFAMLVFIGTAVFGTPTVVPIVRTVLPGKKAATFFQLDRRISMMIDLQLTSQLPLVQSQD